MTIDYDDDDDDNYKIRSYGELVTHSLILRATYIYAILTRLHVEHY